MPAYNDQTNIGTPVGLYRTPSGGLSSTPPQINGGIPGSPIPAAADPDLRPKNALGRREDKKKSTNGPLMLGALLVMFVCGMLTERMIQELNLAKMDKQEAEEPPKTLQPISTDNLDDQLSEIAAPEIITNACTQLHDVNWQAGVASAVADYQSGTALDVYTSTYNAPYYQLMANSNWLSNQSGHCGRPEDCERNFADSPETAVMLTWLSLNDPAQPDLQELPAQSLRDQLNALFRLRIDDLSPYTPLQYDAPSDTILTLGPIAASPGYTYKLTHIWHDPTTNRMVYEAAVIPDENCHLSLATGEVCTCVPAHYYLESEYDPETESHYFIRELMVTDDIPQLDTVNDPSAAIATPQPVNQNEIPETSDNQAASPAQLQPAFL